LGDFQVPLFFDSSVEIIEELPLEAFLSLPGDFHFQISEIPPVAAMS
jgi:hypothetical protein